MKQRKGFTLIELMIVIAIIIILAAIAIPNYLKMTERARRARVAGDFTSLATSLEAYAVDWGAYPNVAFTPTISGTLILKPSIDTLIEEELTGETGAVWNVSTRYTLTGEKGKIDYMKAGTIAAMYDPYDPNAGYYYFANGDGKHWLLSTKIATARWLFRSDMTTDLTESTTILTGIDDAGAPIGYTAVP
jgi:prepilin-type N-terminal cleavage/methylation domain-containing protein